MKIRVGTAGWSIDSRYLSDIPPGGSHLERYAGMFSGVEINSSFYKHHRTATYARWASSVGEDFRFSVKTPKALTHGGALAGDDSEVLSRFLEEVAGLGSKLGVLLVQLPPSLAFDRPDAYSFFSRLRNHLAPAMAIACEPRHPSWGTRSVDAHLRKLSVSRVAADPARWAAAAQPGGDRRVAYFRMHGTPKVYFSDYDPERLDLLRSQLEKAMVRSDSVWCIFDNTAQGHAIGNALSIRRALHP
jgi:uncharacterized protein YecE (DUF72 family)